MNAILGALGALVLGALLALVLRRRPTLASLLGALAPALALAAAAAPILGSLRGGPALALRIEWAAPVGPLLLGLDALTAYFLAVILVISTLAALYGFGYLHRTPRDAASWFFFDLLVASMALVVLARQALVFLLAWEAMALCSFFLVAHESERQEVRRAAWVYLIATHLASLFLLPMFFLLRARGGSLAFADLAAQPGLASVCFALGLVGFGCKAGLVPLHVWLPEAHPAAPSHVSALLSGVMVKTGIYGLLRLLTFLGEPQLSWGVALVALGALSAVLGVLLALAQHDLKRLLAYSTVENVGIIACGLGAGLVGIALGSPTLASLGLLGGLLHVANHACFKGLVFLGAGSVLRATGTAALDTLGGLRRRQPWTAAAFLVGAMALCGLPPLNGFPGELLILLATGWGASQLGALAAAPLALAAVALAAASALALAGVAKAYGIVFLGEPRSPAAATAVEAPASMRGAMAAAAAACLGLGLASPWLLRFAARAAEPLLATSDPGAETLAASALASSNAVTLAVLALALGLWAMRQLLLRRRVVARQPTWDCGYIAPRATMQYTGSSFTQPIVDLFASLLRTRKRVSSPELHFPDAAHVATETPDPGREGIYEPLFETLGGGLRRILILQHGRLHVYVLGLVLTLLALLLWQVS